MPQMDGWRFIEEFEKIKFSNEAQIKLFALSSSLNPNDSLKAKQNSKISEYLSKPLTIDRIASIIKKFT